MKNYIYESMKNDYSIIVNCSVSIPEKSENYHAYKNDREIQLVKSENDNCFWVIKDFKVKLAGVKNRTEWNDPSFQYSKAWISNVKTRTYFKYNKKSEQSNEVEEIESYRVNVILENDSEKIYKAIEEADLKGCATSSIIILVVISVVALLVLFSIFG
mgnify:CR=1 FL=1